jgi:hypothetical protein
MKRGLTLYAGGEDTFCQCWVITPDGQTRDLGQLKRGDLEAQDIKVILQGSGGLSAQPATYRPASCLTPINASDSKE